MSCLKTDFTFRQPPNPSEVYKGIGSEGQVKEDGQETSRGGGGKLVFSLKMRMKIQLEILPLTY